MNKSLFHKAYSLMLIMALAFGQVGAGFFHNKHDAHEAIADIDHTVIVEHGEHCKICSVDWIHQFLDEQLSYNLLEQHPISFEATDVMTVADSFILFENGRAPPFAA